MRHSKSVLLSTLFEELRTLAFPACDHIIIEATAIISMSVMIFSAPPRAYSGPFTSRGLIASSGSYFPARGRAALGRSAR